MPGSGHFSENGSYAVTTAGGTATLTNTIVTSHTVAGFSGTGLFAQSTLFFGNSTTCTQGAICSDILTDDPNFVDANADNYHLGKGSPAVDQGVTAAAISDMDGEPRPMGNKFDLGADEQTPLAAFEAVSAGRMEQPITLTNASVVSGTASFVWNFGDGITSTGRQAPFTPSSQAAGILSHSLPQTTLAVTQ